jgi:hypothetical protein
LTTVARESSVTVGGTMGTSQAVAACVTVVAFAGHSAHTEALRANVPIPQAAQDAAPGRRLT